MKVDPSADSWCDVVRTQARAIRYHYHLQYPLTSLLRVHHLSTAIRDLIIGHDLSDFSTIANVDDYEFCAAVSQGGHFNSEDTAAVKQARTLIEQFYNHRYEDSTWGTLYLDMMKSRLSTSSKDGYREPNLVLAGVRTI